MDLLDSKNDVIGPRYQGVTETLTSLSRNEDGFPISHTRSDHSVTRWESF